MIRPELESLPLRMDPENVCDMSGARRCGSYEYSYLSRRHLLYVVSSYKGDVVKRIFLGYYAVAQTSLLS